MTFYLVYKPEGISSFDVIRKMRRDLNIRKMGHTGTLDPLAQGLMIVATGPSTRLIPFLEKDFKTYKFTFILNGWSETGDREGPIHPIDPVLYGDNYSLLTSEHIERVVLPKFLGKSTQVPPKFSALKFQGKKAYELAREWKDVDMPTRDIEVHSISLVESALPEVTCEARVSAGTYIRTLAEDIAGSMGMRAYTTFLQRISVGHLVWEGLQGCTKELQYKKVEYLDMFPKVHSGLNISETQSLRLQSGLEQKKPPHINEGDYFVVYHDGTRGLIRVGENTMKAVKNNI